jgi:hypothetical protein
MDTDIKTMTKDNDAMRFYNKILSGDRKTMIGYMTTMRCDVETITEYSGAKWFDNSATPVIFLLFVEEFLILSRR